MVQKPALSGDKSLLIALLAVLALSSFGFAAFNIAFGPELSLGQETEPYAQLEIVAVPKTPDLRDLRDFWFQHGFDLMRQEKMREIQVEGSQAWVQGRETWVFVPLSFGQSLSGAMLELCGAFLAEGWLIQIEADGHGYNLGFWSEVPDLGHKVLVYTWHLEVLNPKNYSQYKMGFIPVMGELFDPFDPERGTPAAPVLAVIVDDWGYDTKAAAPLLEYPFPLTIAVLPDLVLSGELSERAAAAGHEVILHQPMEPLAGDLDLGPGGIMVAMDGAEIEEQLHANLASLPVVAGVNNHMGSRATEDKRTMGHVLRVLKDRGLFFVDSSTSSRSIAPLVAQELGVPHAENNLFIDNESNIDTIKEQLRKGLALAKTRGHAVVIGHVRWNTALALWEMIPEFLAEEVDLVPVSAIVTVP